MSYIHSRTTRPSAALLLVTCFASLASASVIYVRTGAAGANNGTSWADAYTDLQNGLLSSQAGDEIRVAQGTYKPVGPGGPRTSSFAMLSGVTILGGFAGSGANPDARDPAQYVTILSGDINGNNVNPSYHVVSATDVDATAVLDGFTITGGRANGQLLNQSSGSGLCFVNTSAQVRACAIVGNNSAGWVHVHSGTVYGRGGGIYIEGGAPLLLNCRIQQNLSRRAGGGIDLLNSSATLQGCHITDNTTGDPEQGSGDGGGIYSEQGGPVFRDTVIDTNDARESGGGVYVRQSTPEFVRCSLSQNQCGIIGGGILIDGSPHADLIDCQVLSNGSSYYGGGIGVVNQSIVEISNCEISANSCPNSGSGAGGMYCRESAASLRGCTITGNHVGTYSPYGGAGGIGGGVLCEGFPASVKMQNCLMEGNAAGDGAFGGSPPGGNGGGLVARNGALAVLVNCTLRGNRAGSGGWGVSRPGGTGGNGGGVFVGSASAQIHGCVFHDNHAGSGGAGDRGSGRGGDGGALYVSDGTCQLTNCTLAQNDTGSGSPDGAGGASVGGVSYSSCVVWANTPDQLAGGPTVRYSDVQDGFAGIGNIAADPGFVDSAADNFRLAPFSPCIDAGENASVPADSLDVDGNGDVTEPTPLDRDGNARFEDDSGTADTGAGTPPIVDMGAYEFGQTSGCPADLDGDGVVSLADLARLLSNFGRSDDATPANGDLNGDESVDLADLALLLASFGMNC
jgi:hypothetical protein